MERSLRSVVKDIPIGKILIQTDPSTGEPQLHYCKLPSDISEGYVMLMDGTIATGAAALMAIRVILDHDVAEDRIIFLSLIAAPQGLRTIANAFPKVKIVTSEVDPGLNERFHIVPGIGNFGEPFATEEAEVLKNPRSRSEPGKVSAAGGGKVFGRGGKVEEKDAVTQYSTFGGSKYSKYSVTTDSTMIHFLRRRMWMFLLLLILTTFCTIFLLSPYSPYVLSPTTHRSYELAAHTRLRNSVKPLHSSNRVVVSLTSFKGRVEGVDETIRSLVAQVRRPDVVYIAIPEDVDRLKKGIGGANAQKDGHVGEKTIEEDVLGGAGEQGLLNLVSVIPRENVTALGIPENVAKLMDEFPDQLRVLHTKDFGPATKLLAPILAERKLSSPPDTIIITVDDDSTYDQEMVLFLVDAAHRNPNSAPCYVCETWPRFWRFLSIGPMYHRWEGVCKGWANAYKGVAYRLGWFDDNEVFDYRKDGTVPEGCRLHDDVWISGNLMRYSKVRPFVIMPGFDPLVAHRRHPSLSINSVPNTEKGYRDPCIKYFDYFAA
ncbi:hypothetical protein HK102_006069 [Quaeritorhiza haematococci]|nr:hypothetical protein HK102_006069 [Quaeritorhiza haematococci]